MAIDFVNGNTSRYYSVDVTTPIVLPAAGFSVGMWLNLPVGFNTDAAFQYFLSTGALNSANNINFFLGEATNFREIFARARSGSSVSEDINNRFVNDVGVSPDGIEVVDHLLIFQGNGTEFEMYWVEAEAAVAGPLNTHPYLPSTGNYTLSTLELGNRTDHNSTRFYQNVMSEVFMLDRVLTPAEIENLATRKPITDEEPSPLLYLRFISPDATIADLSGNGHTATRVGTGYASYAHPIPLQGDYFRDFSGDANEDPFVDPEFTDVAATNKIVSGVLFPNTNAATKYRAGIRVGNVVKAKIQLGSANSDVADYVGAAVYNSSGEGYYAFVGNGFYYIGRTVGMSTDDILVGSTPEYGPGSHLECWYDESTGLVSGYLNGVLLGSYTDTTYAGTFDAGFSFFPLGGNVSGITAFAAEGYDTSVKKGFNFRSTSGFVTDPAGTTYVVAEAYPTTRTGETFGYDSAKITPQVRDRSGTADPRLKGLWQILNNISNTSVFLLDIIPGTYNIRLASGDLQYSSASKVVIRDGKGGAVLTTITGAPAAGNFIDATGAILTAANWVTSNLPLELTFANSQIAVEIGYANTDVTTGDSKLSHFYYELATAVDPTGTGAFVSGDSALSGVGTAAGGVISGTGALNSADAQIDGSGTSSYVPITFTAPLNMFPIGGGDYQLAEGPGYDVYWLIGQSNMVGRPAIRVGIDDDYSEVSTKCKQFGYTSQTLKAATNPLDHVDETAGSMGLWLEFVKARAVVTGREILLVPCAQGGTSFSGNNWNPGNTLYNNALSRLSSAMALGAGSNVLKGVLWLQGESDADAGGVAVTNYQSNLQAMYSAMVANASGMNSSTPFIVGSIKPDKPNAPAINTALQDFATANAPTAYVDLTDLSWYDANHYDAASLATAGTRYAGAF